MPFAQWRLLLTEPEKLDEEWRYAQMNDEVRAKADAMKQKYGRF